MKSGDFTRLRDDNTNYIHVYHNRNVIDRLYQGELALVVSVVGTRLPRVYLLTQRLGFGWAYGDHLDVLR